MDKHTFKVGDRVIVYTGLKHDCVGGQKGFIRERNCEHGARVSFDNGKYNRIGEDIWYVHNNRLTHDTDFQVGDWVRYEGIHPRVVSPLLEGKIGQIDYLSGGSCVGISQFHMQSGGIVYKENLVKIQPPQEEDKKMDIKRKHSDAVITHNVSLGDVHYKGRVIPGFYQEITGNFYPASEWEPVEEWVKIEVCKEQWETINTQIGAFEAWGVDQNYHTVSWRPVK